MEQHLTKEKSTDWNKEYNMIIHENNQKGDKSKHSWKYYENYGNNFGRKYLMDKDSLK